MFFIFVSCTYVSVFFRSLLSIHILCLYLYLLSRNIKLMCPIQTRYSFPDCNTMLTDMANMLTMSILCYLPKPWVVTCIFFSVVNLTLLEMIFFFILDSFREEFCCVPFLLRLMNHDLAYIYVILKCTEVYDESHISVKRSFLLPPANEVWGKVICLQACVCPQGGVPDQVPPPEQTLPLKQTPSRTRYTPLGPGAPPHPLGPGAPPHPPGPDTNPGTTYTPWRRACWEIRSTRGRYASYWNAILLK